MSCRHLQNSTRRYLKSISAWSKLSFVRTKTSSSSVYCAATAARSTEHKITENCIFDAPNFSKLCNDTPPHRSKSKHKNATTWDWTPRGLVTRRANVAHGTVLFRSIRAGCFTGPVALQFKVHTVVHNFSFNLYGGSQVPTSTKNLQGNNLKLLC